MPTCHELNNKKINIIKRNVAGTGKLWASSNSRHFILFFLIDTYLLGISASQSA